MNSEFVQNIRYKLQKRVRRLNSAEHQIFHLCLRQFWGYLHAHEIFTGIMQDLARRCLEQEAEADKIVLNNNSLIFDTELESAAGAYLVLKKCVESNDQRIEVRVGHLYTRGTQYTEHLDAYRSLFLEPFYEYLDEQLDDQRAVLALLLRYKHKCEWFQREYLDHLWRSDTRSGEKKLARHMYEYLHDQGFDFSIEPWSISGEADLIAAQKTDDPLVADAKIFDPSRSKGKSYIVSGFNQVYTYTRAHNEPFGYLVIFKTCEEDLKFTLTNKAAATPFVVHNNKTIFLLTIDIHAYEDSASKRGQLRTIEIIEQDLIQAVQEPQFQPDSSASSPKI